MSSAREFSRVEVEASEWLVAMNDRSVSLDERARFEGWLAASPEHERVYRVQKSAWSAVSRMPHLLAESRDSSPPLPLWERAGVRGLFAAAATLATLVLLVAWLYARGGGELTTRIAQIKDFTLSDGTVVTLGASSSIRVAFSDSVRRVTLEGGEAFFEVARDTARPFTVNAGRTEVRVLGTKFDVHYGAEAVRVSVLEGRVQVRQSEKDAATRVLSAGESVIAPRVGRAAPIHQVDEPDVGAWRSGRLVYVDTRLRDVIADVNRYYDGEIELADAAAGDLQVTAAFRADQIDRMLEVLTNALPIEARRNGKRIAISSQNR